MGLIGLAKPSAPQGAIAPGSILTSSFWALTTTGQRTDLLVVRDWTCTALPAMNALLCSACIFLRLYECHKGVEMKTQEVKEAGAESLKS
jgi:hypothetical protein